jgi:phage-related protein (TIGR01555 family)
MIRDWLRAWLLGTSAPLEVGDAPAPLAPRRGVSDLAVTETSGMETEAQLAATWRVPEAPPGMLPANMAMDSVPANIDSGALYAWAISGAFAEGLGFLGYQYLSELSQRPEYRHVVATYASEATRKWIKLTGADDETLGALEKELQRFNVQALFRELSEHDGFFGRGQIFVDFGDFDDREELAKPLLVNASKIGKGKLKNLKAVEPIWSYPGVYNSTNPLAPDFYVPKHWYVMGKTVHATRLLTLVSREMPDMLKPAYAFGGVALTQMIKPYVDNWLRTRQAVADLVASFSMMILGANLGSVLEGGAAQQLLNRIRLFNNTRNNRGLMVVDKETEELDNVTTPLGTLDALQAQTQEHIASVAGIPLVILLGVTPSGLNASSDGEIRAFYDKVLAYQERIFRKPLQTILQILQLNSVGEINPEIGFDFNSLWEMTAIDAAAVKKSEADTDVAYVSAGVLDPVEVRGALAADDGGRYRGIDAEAAPVDDLPPDDGLGGEVDDAPGD